MSDNLPTLADEFKKLPGYHGSSKSKAIWNVEWSKPKRDLWDQKRWSKWNGSAREPVGDFMKVFALPCSWFQWGGEPTAAAPNEMKVVHVWWLREHAVALLELLLNAFSHRRISYSSKITIFHPMTTIAPETDMSNIRGFRPLDNKWVKMKFRYYPTFDLTFEEANPIMRSFIAQSNQYAAGRVALEISNRCTLEKPDLSAPCPAVPTPGPTGASADGTVVSIMSSYRDKYADRYEKAEPRLRAVSYFIVLDRDWASKGAIICNASSLQSRRCDLEALPLHLAALEMGILPLHGLQTRSAPAGVLEFDKLQGTFPHSQEKKLTLSMLAVEEKHYSERSAV